MSLLSVGPVMFGGTGRIVSYLRARHLLAANKNCTRCMQIVILIGSLKAIYKMQIASYDCARQLYIVIANA